MTRHFSIVIALLFAVLTTLGFASDGFAAKPKPAPTVSIEDNMGFVGTAWLFTLNDDGSWEYRRFFPRNTKGVKDGKLNKDEAKAFIAKLEKAGAFNPKAKDIEPHNPQLADGAYLAVTSPSKIKGKGSRLRFKHGGPTSKAVAAVIGALAGKNAAAE